MKKDTLIRQIAPTVTDFISERKSRGLSRRTIQYYQSELGYFRAWLDQRNIKRLDEIGAGTIREYLTQLGKTRNPGGIHAMYRALRALYNWLKFEFDWPSPMVKVRPPKIVIVPLPGVSLDNVELMTKGAGLRDKALLLTLLDTGARASEVINMNISDLDWSSGAIIIRKGKGGKYRTVYLGQKARRAVRAYLRSREGADDHSPLFCTSDRERLTLSALRDMIRRRAIDNQVTPVPCIHDFRRACALQLHRNGEDILTISRYLGHSTIEVTRRYIDLNDHDLREAHMRSGPVDHP